MNLFNFVRNRPQYCAKVTQAKCPNFVFFSRELSSKFRAKVRITIRGFLSEFSDEQRALFRRIFASKRKFGEIIKKLDISKQIPRERKLSIGLKMF